MMDTQHPEIWLEAELPLILIAQPDAEVRRGMAEALDDYQICQVGDGLEALEVAREMEPDAIIADFDLPGLSGVNLCRRLREEEALCRVPVALTLPRCDEAFGAALEAGAAEVVVMPYSPVALKLRVRNLVKGTIYVREVERKNRVIIEALNDLRESEAMLVHAEKLSLLGELSTGIVHEINNPLNYSKSALFLLRRLVHTMEPGSEREEFEDLVGDVADGVERVTRIVRDLRAFASKRAMGTAEVDLRQVVRTARRLMGSHLSNLNYVEEMEEGLIVRGNENSLCQVVINLLKNGVEATEDAGRGLDDAEIRVTGEEDREGVILRVRDNGCGISKKARVSMFEPFFTTKDPGRGMGLGLSVCRRILEEHGVTIGVDSVPGQFTQITLRFPERREAADGESSGNSEGAPIGERVADCGH